MTPERWQQIKVALHDALEVPPDRRSEFLAQACAEDDALRREVESFLALGEQGARTSFLESAGDHSTLSLEARIRDYEVKSLLGVGGMGEVYRAHDPRLQRDVAIKVLPSVFASDPDRLHRFEQEARAAAALNHPNIVAIYDLGTTDKAAPLRHSEMFSDLPATGIKSESDVAHLRGVQVIPELAYPGPDGSRYALSRWAVHRNIYRIPIP